MGSSSCAGREKRTAARSETPTKRRRMETKVLNLEPSSGAFSAGAVGGAAESTEDGVAEPLAIDLVEDAFEEAMMMCEDAAPAVKPRIRDIRPRRLNRAV